MTPARILAICQDEWPALRWRIRDGDPCGLARGLAVVVVVSEVGPWLYIDVWDGPVLRAVDGHDMNERGIRSALREARRAVTS